MPWEAMRRIQVCNIPSQMEVTLPMETRRVLPGLSCSTMKKRLDIQPTLVYRNYGVNNFEHAQRMIYTVDHRGYSGRGTLTLSKTCVCVCLFVCVCVPLLSNKTQ